MRRSLTVGSHHDGARSRLLGDSLHERLRKTSVVEAREQDQISARQRRLDRGQHPGLDFRTNGVLPKMVDPQQRLVMRAKTLFAGSWAATIVKAIKQNALALERRGRKFCRFVITDNGAIAHLRAHPTRMSRNSTGTTHERLGINRCDDDRRIFLGHSEWIAGYVIIDDEVSDH